MCKVLSLILFVTMITACERSDEEKLRAGVVAKMSWLYKADPEADAAKALRKKDYRFVGIYGVARYFPGVDDDCAIKLTEFRMIDGTSDVILGYEHAKLNAIADEYATHYNFVLRKHFRDAGKDVCGA